MTEDYVDFVAAAASDIHKVRVGGGNKSLELVGLFLLFDGGVQKISVHLWNLKYLYKYSIFLFSNINIINSM